VFKYDGIVDKYIGDALMAVFGTLEEEQDPEYRAVAACLDFRKAIAEMNEERLRNRKEPIAIGVGVNTGNDYCFVYYLARCSV
jgi:adenylate cyclase